jgi:predicted house-cleaning NTP pyrophosphatase (Maf/HAM1 superfamily)
MRAYDRGEAAAYVEAFRPLDCVGSYRIEDDADLIESVEGSGQDGVIGLPLAVVRRLVAEVSSG